MLKTLSEIGVLQREIIVARAETRATKLRLITIQEKYNLERKAAATAIKNEKKIEEAEKQVRSEMRDVGRT